MLARFAITICRCALMFACLPILFTFQTARGMDTDYPHDYKALMEKYRARVTRLTSQPLPPKSAPKEVKRAAIVRQIEDVARAYTDFVGRLSALKPPVRFRDVHSATLTVFQVNAQDYQRWAEAVRHGNRQERDRVLKENEARELKATSALQRALKRAGGSSPQLNSIIGEMRKSIGTP